MRGAVSRCLVVMVIAVGWGLPVRAQLDQPAWALPPPPPPLSTSPTSTSGAGPGPGTVVTSGTTLPSSAEPEKSALGSDISLWPRRFPNGDWLPIVAPLLSMQLIVPVTVNGVRTEAILDTGAMGTTMSQPMARKLGVIGDDIPHGTPVRAVDAHGDVIFGEKVRLGSLTLGERRFDQVWVTVLGDSPDLFLIGADVLQQVDLMLVADEGLVGIFAAGAAPRLPGDQVVRLERGERQLTVTGTARGRDGDASFKLLVDTGAWNTSVPAVVGVNAGIAADLAYTSTTVGVAGEQEARGRFIIDHLMLGSQRRDVGRVLAVAGTMESGEGLGLLGNDVMMRFHTVISFRDSELRLLRPPPRGPVRLQGPGGSPCGTAQAPRPCIAVRLAESKAIPAADDWPGVCLQIDVDASYAQKTVELAITVDEPSRVSLFNGGAIRAFVSADSGGAHHCFALWPQLQRLGVQPTTPLTLRWVRTEGVRWPCDPMKTRCITFTGPLARLETR